MSRRIPTKHTNANIEAVLSMLVDTPNQLEQLSEVLSSEALVQPIDAGERSFKENLAHLLILKPLQRKL